MKLKKKVTKIIDNCSVKTLCENYSLNFDRFSLKIVHCCTVVMPTKCRYSKTKR